LTDRAVRLEHFIGDSFRDPAIRDLLARIHAAPHPEMTMDTREHFGAEVRVTLTDGRVLVQTVRQAVGRGSDDPLPPALLEAKFLDCATHVLPPDKARALLTTLRRLQDAATINDVTQAMM
jgi:2-methylcitrate dehydratase PrpD